MPDSPLLTKLRRHRSVWLLAAIALCLLVSPLEEMGHLPPQITNLLFGLIVLTLLNSATGRGSHLGVAGSFASVWLISRVIGELSEDGTGANVIGDLALIGLVFFTIYLILRPLLTARTTDFDSLCAAIGAYLLIGIAWALSYVVVERLAPGSFGLETEFPWSDALYFSLTTLTTLGYGDITPASPVAGVWATLEAVFGQLYIAVLVARLVALIRR